MSVYLGLDIGSKQARFAIARAGPTFGPARRRPNNFPISCLRWKLGAETAVYGGPRGATKLCIGKSEKIIAQAARRFIRIVARDPQEPT